MRWCYVPNAIQRHDMVPVLPQQVAKRLRSVAPDGVHHQRVETSFHLMCTTLDNNVTIAWM